MLVTRKFGLIQHHAKYALKARPAENCHRTFISSRSPTSEQLQTAKTSTNVQPMWQRKVFSGAKPSGDLHMGNYLGAIQQWKILQDANENVTFCIADMHALTVPQSPAELRNHIFRMAATLLACGIKPEKATLFVQSAINENTELCWILGKLVAMTRLGHLPQYRQKTRALRDVSLGVYMYPVLQAADIMLHKATHVPVGMDQMSHIQLAQHLADMFNRRYGLTFPLCETVANEDDKTNVKSLTDPSAKMSKSDPNQYGTIYLADEPDVIVDKIKRTRIDFQSDVTYDEQTRPGISNLIAIHSHICGKSIEDIVAMAKNMDTTIYKSVVTESIVEHLKPIQLGIKRYLIRRNDLVHILDTGAQQARAVCEKTLEEVMQKMGMGASHAPILLDHRLNHRYSGGAVPLSTEAIIQDQDTGTMTPESAMFLKPARPGFPTILDGEVIKTRNPPRPKPIVPQQPIRMEKTRSPSLYPKINFTSRNDREPFTFEPNKPFIKFNDSRVLRNDPVTNARVQSHGTEYLKRVAATASKLKSTATDDLPLARLKYATAEKKTPPSKRQPAPSFPTTASYTSACIALQHNNSSISKNRDQSYLTAAEMRNKEQFFTKNSYINNKRPNPGNIYSTYSFNNRKAAPTTNNETKEKAKILNELQNDLRIAIMDDGTDKTKKIIDAVERLKEVVLEKKQKQYQQSVASKEDCGDPTTGALVVANKSMDVISLSKTGTNATADVLNANNSKETKALAISQTDSRASLIPLNENQPKAVELPIAPAANELESKGDSRINNNKNSGFNAFKIKNTYN